MTLDRKISVVLPARNEEDTVGKVVNAIRTHPSVEEIIVVDNASTDGTAVAASESGATVVSCPKLGVGSAMKAGIAAAKNDHILRSDADIANWIPKWIDILLPKRDHVLNRGIYTSPYSQFPMSNYVVRPFFILYKPEWRDTLIPTTGTYLLDRRDYDWDNMPDNWAIDVAVLVKALSSADIIVSDLAIGELADKVRHPTHYIPMATEISEFLTSHFRNEINARFPPNR